MTSAERREHRYQRRCEQRRKKRLEKYPHADDFEAVFSFQNLWRSYKKCRRNVAWKGSVQRYIFEAPSRVSIIHQKLMDGKYRCVTPYEWDTWERGHLRHIKSVTIGERVMQRCLADNCLVPLLSRSFIYDNGACLPFKGYDFAMRRIQCHLNRFYRETGTNDGYILLFDFSKFYDRIDHGLLREKIKRKVYDPRIQAVVDSVMATFGNVGLGLGSQISQVLALTSGNDLDHFIKEQLRITQYARYNDDGYLMHKSKAYLQYCLEKVKDLCRKLHIVLNEKKTKIVKIKHGFSFLKARIFLTDTGKVVRKIPKRSVVRERRKLKKLKKKLSEGLIDMEHIYIAYQSWRSFATKFQSWHTVQDMDRLYHRLYLEEILCHSNCYPAPL